MPQYWMVMTSRANFAISRRMGYTVDGFKDNPSGRRVNRMKPGDRVVHYISGAHKFGALTEVTSAPYRDDKNRIWIEKDEMWPLRVRLKPEVVLDEDQLVDVRKLIPHLSFVPERLAGNYGVVFQGSLRNIPDEDFQLIASEIHRAAGQQAPPPVTHELTEQQAKEAIMQLPLDAASLHDRIGEMLEAIGTWMGYNAHTRYRVTSEHAVQLDVAWLRSKNPDVAIEVQIGGSIVEAKDKLDQARRFNYRKVIMVIEEDQLDTLNDRIKFDELRHWLAAWSIQSVYRLYAAGREFFSLYGELDESRYVDRQVLALV